MSKEIDRLLDILKSHRERLTKGSLSLQEIDNLIGDVDQILSLFERAKDDFEASPDKIREVLETINSIITNTERVKLEVQRSLGLKRDGVKAAREYLFYNGD